MSSSTVPAADAASVPALPRLDDDLCYRAIASRDARFDGRFVVGVTTTGIYCRPSCPVPTRPKRVHTRFFRTAAAAHADGFRACKRCAPDSSPGSPEWDVRGDLAARAMRLIADGTVERDGVPGVAARLSVTPRHLHRVLVRELGAPPLRLARAHRAVTARTLIETSRLPFGEVAFAAGFGSIRQFNDTIRAVYDRTPTELRARAVRRDDRARPAASETIEVRLATRAPFAAEALWRWLAAGAIPGVEEVSSHAYRRTLRLPGGPGIVTLVPHETDVLARLVLHDLRDLPSAVARCRRILDLDADPCAVDEILACDPALRPFVDRSRGTRVPAAPDGDEALLRAVLAQQVTTVSARSILARVTASLGEPLTQPDGTLTHLLPAASALADADPEMFGVPRRRAVGLQAAARAVADGSLDLSVGADREHARARLIALPGIGPWTADVIAIRALHDPDVLPADDLALRQAGAHVGIRGELSPRAASWAPWRSYAAHVLWDHALRGGHR